MTDINRYFYPTAKPNHTENNNYGHIDTYNERVL